MKSMYEKDRQEIIDINAKRDAHFSTRYSCLPVRHIMGISGGKDSAALAIHIKDKYPEIHSEMEYFFTDTGKELPEVYEFLDQMENYLGKPVLRLGADKGFDWWLKYNHGFLPSHRARWCTKYLKIVPFEKFVGASQVISYVGIRADENRKAYMSKKKNIKAVYPLSEDGLVRKDIFDILERTVGIPKYYEWRSRSGCYFCFFQRQGEWLGLKERHPKLFEKAKAYEKQGEGYKFNWTGRGNLDEVIERAKLAKLKAKLKPEKDRRKVTWEVMLRDTPDEHESDQACAICAM